LQTATVAITPAPEKESAANVSSIIAEARNFPLVSSRLLPRRLMTVQFSIFLRLINKMRRLPSWFKQEIPRNTTISTACMISGLCLHTVCQEAKCPNLNSCFGQKRATFLILGKTCTRDCRFCAVEKLSQNTALGLDEDEPWRIFEVVKNLGLRYVVLTSVTRDDLQDGGAGIFARSIKLLQNLKDVKIEVLIPDFGGKILNLQTVLEAKPDCVGHNLETVQGLYKKLRPMAFYRRSLEVLSAIKEINPAMITKSSIMLGLGETEEEIVEAMKDLRKSNCDILTLGQYLAPSPQHYPVREFISPDQFKEYKDMARDLGFKAVLSAPLARSSYKAEELYKELTLCTI